MNFFVAVLHPIAGKYELHVFLDSTQIIICNRHISKNSFGRLQFIICWNHEKCSRTLFCRKTGVWKMCFVQFSLISPVAVQSYLPSSFHHAPIKRLVFNTVLVEFINEHVFFLLFWDGSPQYRVFCMPCVQAVRVTSIVINSHVLAAIRPTTKTSTGKQCCVKPTRKAGTIASEAVTLQLMRSERTRWCRVPRREVGAASVLGLV